MKPKRCYEISRENATTGGEKHPGNGLLVDSRAYVPDALPFHFLI